MKMPSSIRRGFWDSVIVIEERADFYDCLYLGGTMTWGEMLRNKMQRDIELRMKMRRIRRAWYHLLEDTPDNIAGFMCLLLALGVCAGLWYAYGTWWPR